MILSDEQQDVLETILSLPGGEVIYVDGEAGCLCGDTVMRIQRGMTKKVYRMTLEELYHKFNDINGTHHRWPTVMPTKLESHDEIDGSVKYNTIVAISDEGVQEIFELETTGGRKLKLTADHPVLTQDGYVEAKDLKIGEPLIVRGSLKPKKNPNKKGRKARVVVEGLKHYSGGWDKYVTDQTSGKRYYYKRQHRARLVVEASFFGITYEDYIDKLKTRPGSEKLASLDRNLVVHHKNGDPMDDRLENLEVMTKKEHDSHHGSEDNFDKDWTDEDFVLKVSSVGFSRTYDIQMTSPRNNFCIDNGLIVHNTGKSFTIQKACSLLGNVLKCAPSGIASTNIGGRTFHKTFQLNGDFYFDPRSIRERNKALFAEYGKAAGGMVAQRLCKHRVEILKLANAIWVDEAPMVRCDLIDEADIRLRHVMNKPHIPFGGKRMIFSGDLGQLCPVVSEEDAVKLEAEGYESPWGFRQARVFNQD